MRAYKYGFIYEPQEIWDRDFLAGCKREYDEEESI